MSEKKGNTLKEKKERFCIEYSTCFNATESAIKAGYSKKTARSIGQRLLTNVDIQNRLKELQKPIADQLNITRERIARNILKIAEPDNKVIDPENGVFPTKESDILKANELLAKMFGFNEPDKIDMTSKGESIKPDAPYQIIISGVIKDA